MNWGYISSFLPIIVILLVGYFIWRWKPKKPVNSPRVIPVQIPDDQSRRNPGVAAVLSIIIPGLGQIYNGNFIQGIVYMVLYAFGWAFSLGGIFTKDGGGLIFFGIILMLIAWIAGARNAYNSAVKINIALDYKKNDEMKKCPYCAEMIKVEAIVCRYCQRELRKEVS